MKVKKAYSVCAVLATALFAVYSYGEGPKAVLNAKQLGIQDLDIDLGLEEDIKADTEAAAVTAEAAPEAVKTDADPVAEAVADAPAAVDVVAEVPAVVEPVAEAVPEVVAEVPDVAEVVAEPIAEVVAEAPAVAEPVAEVVAEPIAEVVAEAPAVAEPVAEVVAEPIAEVAAEAPAVAEPVVEVVAEPIAEVAAEAPAVAEPVAEVVAEPLVEVVAEAPAVVEPVLEPVAEPVVEVVAEPAVEAVAEPVVEAVPEAVVEAAAEPAVEVVPEAVVEAAAEPAVEAVPEAVVEAGAVSGDAMGKTVSELATLEKARRMLFENHGRDCLEQGIVAFQVGNWTKAAEKFKEAIKFLPERDATLQTRREAERQLAETYYRMALEQKSNNNLDEAEKSANESKRMGHPKAEKLLVDIKDTKENPPPIPPPPREKRWIQPEYKKDRADISNRMKIAREFYGTGEYAKCRETVELILKDHPWEKDAVDMLRKVSIAEHKYVDNERITSREQMIKDVTEAWSPRTYGRDYSVSEVKVDPRGNGEPLVTTDEMKIIEKMKSITIPEIDFRQANITDIVNFLTEASREFDKQELPPEQRGVNIVLKLDNAGAAAPVETAPVDDWGAANLAAPAATGGVPLITINTRYVTLLGALDMIMELANLKYRVRDNVVLIMPENAPEGKLIHRMYNVLPSLVERRTMLPGAEEGGGFDGFPGAISAGTTTQTNPDWKEFFGKLGVEWPQGSTCQHMPQIGKLVVLNTSQNLARLESVLAVLNVTPKQIEIEVRFVEVMQSDLDSLGLEWILNDDWEIAEMKDDAGLPAASRRRVTMKSGSVNSGFNYLNKNDAQEINDGSPVMDNIATFTSILTNPELTVVLHMLSNKRNTDLLSAPKVVSQAGTPATIKVVTEYIYPTEYDVEMLESTSGDSDVTTYSGAVVEPQNFQMREVGVILEVTPDVTPDGSMINLALAPSVVSEPTWRNYGSTYPVATPVGFDALNLLSYFTTEYVQLPMEQPFFPVRSVATSVQIYNGATVVMGGMITEERYTNEDKIPFLGDIPVIGKLFRNKYELSEKRNLLLFVTARLVDPAGREVKDSTNDGMALLTEGQ